MMAENNVREVHGVRCSVADNKWTRVIIDECEDGRIRVDESYKERYLTPAQARHLASKLYRLARRIERRAVGAV